MSVVAGDPHSLEEAAGGQTGYHSMSSIPFMSICMQVNHAIEDYLSLN